MLIVAILALRAMFRRLRCRSLIGKAVVALLLCSALSGEARSQAIGVSREAVNALNQSYAIGRRLRGQERISYLIELTRAGVSIDPDSTRHWCEQLFALSSRSPLDWDHVAGQKNAAVALAPLDANRAMELLARVDPPQPLDGHFPEDVRADAAAHIFPWFWQAYGMKRLARIQFQARDIGDTGEYPYRAMAGIIDHLLDLNSPDASVQAEAGFRDALGYYKRHSKFSNEEEEFLDLLAIGRRIGAPDAYREGLELFIARVSVPADSDVALGGTPQTAQGNVRLQDHNQRLLSRVLPLVTELDPAWTQKLIEQRPELKAPENDVELLGAAIIHGDPTAQDVEARQRLMLEKALLPKIAAARQTDPQAAAQMAMSLTTLPTRITAISIVLPSLIGSDPIQARHLYDQQVGDLEHVQDSHDRLRALAAISESAFFMRDAETLRSRANEMIDAGILLFEKDSKKRRAKIRDGYEEMSQFVAFAAQHKIAWVTERVDHIHDGLLKAHLLIFVAKGILKAANP
jgi:hypothetical protein